MKKLFFLLALLSLTTLGAQDDKKTLVDLAATEELSQEVVDLFQKMDIHTAFLKMAQYWPLPDNEIESLEGQTIRYLNMLSERFGEVQGSAKVKTEYIGDFAQRETYILRYEYSAIRIIFSYFRNDEGWVINAFKWDDSFEEEFIIDK